MLKFRSIWLPIQKVTIARLAAHPRIGYIKDASTNTGRLLSIMNRCGDSIKVFSASAHIPAAVMLIGWVGWMAGPACLIPRLSVELYDLCKAARWDEALALQRRLWRVNEAFARYNLAACIKAGLAIQGYEVGDPVAPQGGIDGGRAQGGRGGVAGYRVNINTSSFPGASKARAPE